MFASAGAGLSKTDHSRVLCRKVDLRVRKAERLISLGAGIRHFSLRRRLVFEKSWSGVFFESYGHRDKGT
jgi:hypothetical protein